jgi:hypothetical protein
LDEAVDLSYDRVLMNECYNIRIRAEFPLVHDVLPTYRLLLDESFDANVAGTGNPLADTVSGRGLAQVTRDASQRW